MKHIFVAALTLCALSGLAQKKAKPETYAKTITAADLSKHLYIIAGPEMEGRETATPGQRKAAAYIENEFRRIGLQPGNNGSFQMQFPVYQDTLLDATLEVRGKRFAFGTDFSMNVANVLDATMRFGEILYIPSNTPADSLRNMNLGGRAVMISQPAGGNINGLINQLGSRGVGAIFIHNAAFNGSTAQRKGNQSIAAFRRALPVQQFVVSDAVARAIAGDQFNALTTPTPVSTELMTTVKKNTLTAESSNVLGVLPGTDLKDEYLFITAHYDHLGVRNGQIYFGADDDGSGTVGVIEIAEAFAKAKSEGKGPRRSIVFMAVSGEEKGLWGSQYYSENPLFPLEKTTANLNIDMIGRSDATRPNDTLNYVYVVGDDKLSTDLRPISESVNNKYTKLQLDYKYNDPNDRNRIYFRSDHYNFARKGVPIIFYYDGMLGADYHKPTDTPDKINYNLLARRAQLVFHTAWEMVNRNDMLKRDLSLNIPSR